jgi:ferredoxin
MNFIFLLNSPKNPINILKNAEARLGKITNDITNRKSKFIKPKKRVGNATKYFGKSNFMLTSSCTKCGTCTKVCPANNIVLNEVVTFGDKCETCYACVNLCPAHAIYSNKATLKRRQYRNPFVSVVEIVEVNTTNLNKENDYDYPHDSF